MRRVWNDLNQIKAAQCYSDKSLFENPSQQQHLVSSSYQCTQTWVKLLTNNCLKSEFSAQPLSKSNTFRFLDGAMFRYNQTQDSLYDLTELALLCIVLVRPEVDLTSNCGHNPKKTVLFEKMVHFIDKKNTVLYVGFECGIIFFSGSPTKVPQNNRERKIFSISCKNPSSSQVTITLTVQLIRSTPLILFWAPTNYGTWIQHLL